MSAKIETRDAKLEVLSMLWDQIVAGLRRKNKQVGRDELT